MKRKWQHGRAKWGAIGWPFASLASAIFAAWPVFAQDITLTSRNGALAVSGNLNSYDGEFYRLVSEFGPLTIAADSVICDGPACPDLSAPKAVIRLTGDDEVGQMLLPPLIDAFATEKGYVLRAANAAGEPSRLLQPTTNAVLAEFYFTPRDAEAARSAMADAVADLVVARFAPLDSPALLLALDALVPIVSPKNPVARLSTGDIAAILAGEITNWSEVGGSDTPIVLHGLGKSSDLTAALTARLGKPVAELVEHGDMRALAAAVARDPWALAMTGRIHANPARVLTVTDSCGFTLQPGPMSVKTDDYPITLPVFLLTPQRRLPLLTREFLEFLASPAAQAAIAKSGFVARTFERAPLAADSTRLINAIKAAPDDTGLDMLQNLTLALETFDRASITLRFDDGSTDLDLRSRLALADLAQFIASDLLRGEEMVLMGFVPSGGDSAIDAAESLVLAEAVLAQLKLLAPDLPSEVWPKAASLGAGMPLACDTTPAGKRLNRRVELWLRAAATP